MRIFTAVLIGFIGLLVLSACGPIMETHYDYQPPKSGSGMQCVQNCQADQSACQNFTRRQKEDCRHDAERQAERRYRHRMDEYVYALKRHAKSPDDYPEPKEPRREYPNYYACDNLGNECVPQFHACYRSCGGQVFEQQVCVANCEQ